MTNADCIRHMSDEQLYEFLSEWECGDIDYSVTFCDLCNEATKRGEIGNVLNLDCDGCRKHWLQRDAVEYGGLMYWKKNTTFDATADRKTENSSEKPNNCEHITEDGVTCAKYPACDYCLDNPLNKVKGSERLLKGKTEPTISKMEQVEDETQTEEHCENCRHKDECEGATYEYKNTEWWCLGYEPIEDEPQTERSE